MGEGMGVTQSWPMESIAGVGDHDRAAQKVPQGSDRHTDTICPLYDDKQ